MGLFDNVVCNYPLPDGAPRTGYQTKDTDRQYLETYTITEDGLLLDPDGVPVDFHGDLNFYTSNWTASWGDIIATTNDEPWAAWDFTARFTEGRVARITGGFEPLTEGRRHVTRAEFARLSSERRKLAEPSTREVSE